MACWGGEVKGGAAPKRPATRDPEGFGSRRVKGGAYPKALAMVAVAAPRLSAAPSPRPRRRRGSPT